MTLLAYDIVSTYGRICAPLGLSVYRVSSYARPVITSANSTMCQ